MSNSASGALPFKSIILMLLFGSLFSSGAAVGGYYLSESIGLYLIVLFPILQGLLAGAGVLIGVKTGACRNAAAAGLFGLIFGIVSYAGMYYFSFLQNVLYANGGWEAVKTNWYNVQVFTSFMEAYARIGYTIKSLEVQNTFFWVLSGIEVVMAAGVASMLPYSTAKEPFCEGCKRWFTKEDLGIAPLSSIDVAVDRLHERNWAGLRGLFTPTMDAQDRIVLFVKKCPTCPSIGYLTLRSIIGKGNKTNETTLIDDMEIGVEDMKILLSASPRGEALATE